MRAGDVQLAVEEIGDARLPGQFQISLSPGRGWVRHEIAAWSVGLRWRTFRFDNAVDDAGLPLLSAGRDREYIETIGQPAMNDWMQGYHRRHLMTHQVALGFGLSPGGCHDLPVERILIDRVLKRMLERERIDVHGPAESLSEDDNYIQFLVNDLESMAGYFEERRFQLRQKATRLPEISAWLPLGGSTYCGHALDLKTELPETIRIAIAGRRLGELVTTGYRRLDARVVTEVIWSPTDPPDHWPIDTKTRLCLEPDLVELGPITERK